MRYQENRFILVCLWQYGQLKVALFWLSKPQLEIAIIQPRWAWWREHIFNWGIVSADNDGCPSIVSGSYLTNYYQTYPHGNLILITTVFSCGQQTVQAISFQSPKGQIVFLSVLKMEMTIPCHCKLIQYSFVLFSNLHDVNL